MILALGNVRGCKESHPDGRWSVGQTNDILFCQNLLARREEAIRSVIVNATVIQYTNPLTAEQAYDRIFPQVL